MSTAILFDYEKLNVPSKSLEFVGWVTGLLEKVSKSAAVYSQLDRASASVLRRKIVAAYRVHEEPHAFGGEECKKNAFKYT